MLTRGKVAKVRKIVAVRELVRDDLACLREQRSPNMVKRLRDPHHRLARMVASGMRPRDIHARSGYSVQRLSSLMLDPSFLELVAEYRKDVHEKYLESVDDFAETSIMNMMKAERMLAEKLDEADEQGELLPTKDLIAITSDRADRFGYGKKQTNLNVNVDFADQLQRAIARSGKAQLVEAKAVESGAVSPPPPRAAPSSSRMVEQPVPFRRRA